MIKMYQLLLLGLSLSMWACPDNTTGGGGEAGSGGGAVSVSGEMVAGGDEGGESMGAQTTGGPCFDDTECPDGTYCELGDSFEGSCVEGCQEGACDGGRVCDIDSRECIFPPCAVDSDCPEGAYCDEETSVCESGCRVDEACPDAFDEEGRAILCDPLTRECVSHSPCCASADGEESCIAATADQCTALDGQLMQSALLCDDNPCGQTCELDVDCRDLDQGGATFYCDPVDSRCREGCREGECDGDLVCDSVSRLCTNLSCVSSEDCTEEQYCDPVDLVCITGCGDDSDCESGFTCSDNSCVERCDPDADTCADGSYCDELSQSCRDECSTHADCGESEACDPLTSRCQAGACRDDEPLGELTGEPNSTFDVASLLTLVPLAADPDYSSARAEGRIICGGDLDYYRLSLGQGERMRVTLSHDGGGDLNLRIFAVNDTSVVAAEANSLETPEILEYPAEGEVRDAQDYFVEVGGTLAEETRLTYNLSVQTAPLGNACFFDTRESDVGDNDKDNATALIPNSDTRYDDGSICVGDEDWFSLPLTVNDGLNIEVRTAIAAQSLRVDIFSGSSLNAIGGNPSPAYSSTFETSVEESASGDRVYLIDVPFNTAGFDDDTWYVRVIGGENDSFANYRFVASHQSSGQVCTADIYEPNNGVGAGVDVVNILNFPTDDQGLLAQGQDNRIQDMTLCSGDTDYFCFDLAGGDKVESWVISDDTIGSLSVSFVDGEGGSVGSEGRHTITGADFDEAAFIGAPEGRYCVVVNGLGNAQGSYELNIRRSVIMGGVCGEDENDGRNDIAGEATELDDISGGQGTRFEYINGLMCGAATDRADWYRFPVNSAQSSICAMLEGFEHDDVVGGLDIELYEVPREDTMACTNDSNCMDGSCIDGHCQVPSRDSTYIYDFEMLQLPKVNVSEGDHYLKVTADGTSSSVPYDLRVTVTPGRDSCQPDWQEVGDPNDNSRANGFDPSRATVLGSGSVGLCDTWVCNNGAGNYDEDWYQITVPAQQDRTVIISFGSQSDGPLELYYFGQTETSMGEDVIMGSTTPMYNHQCLNISGGSIDSDLEFGVASLFNFVDDGDERIDYSLRVVPTDLVANPDGECGRFGAGEFNACDANDSGQADFSFAQECWPTVYLP